MGLRRWDPFLGLTRMRDEMDRWFEDLLPARRGAEQPGLRLPAVDVMETDEAVVVKAELPGVDKKDLNVEVLSDSVSISAQTTAETETKEETYYRRERRWGAFERIVPLPAEVKPADAKARMKDGLLEVTLPKAQPVPAKEATKVKVESEE